MTDVIIKVRPRGRDSSSAPGDDLVQPDRRGQARRRLVVELSPDLHRRILTISAARGLPVNQAVREVLEQAFPGSST